MYGRIVADRYARALLASCPDLATIERVDDELAVLQRVYETSSETREFLLNPKMPPKVKIGILHGALSDKFSGVVMKLLVLLIEKRRQKIIPEIATRFNELTDSARGVEHAEIVVARPLEADLQRRMLDAVQRFSSREVEIAIRVDPRIIGGVQIRLGDKVVDGSLSSRFEDIRRTMLAARIPRGLPSKG